MWTGSNEWTYKFCYRKNKFSPINIGNQTRWNKKVNINCPFNKAKVTNKHEGCASYGRHENLIKENQLYFDCEFDVDPSKATPTLIKILHKHNKKWPQRLTDDQYNKFMAAYLFTNLGDHKCTKDPITQGVYEFCPKYFSEDAKEIQDILKEWRNENPGLWNSSVKNYCSRFPNKTFCECVGAENIDSDHYHVFKQLGKIGSQIQCFFYPCQTPETRFTYTHYDDTSNCRVSCASFFNLENEVKLDQTYIDSYINCNDKKNTNESDNKNENEVKKQNKIKLEDYYIYAGVAWIFIVFLYILSTKQ